ncbi:hypothetical protein ACFV0H_04395 [Streptomyces erythrochromogenes]|uniref:Uncharacterized protein n=1 Tax=Streptomyces erythrochromogenes TaxID=285574 RepID=A0ABZ1QKR8_9ACTN|nr:hypothetical protein [Streptomyces erythrochromogenes]MCX5589426.1 hypothetical protein [Streptomyces erythrochromogenes]
MRKGKKQRRPAMGMPPEVLVIPVGAGRAMSVTGVGRTGHVREGAAR